MSNCKLGHIPLDSIILKDRVREEMGDIEGLANSIKESGLIQPLAVKETPEGYILLAGGRRYEALKLLNMEKIPVRIYTDISELQMKIIEKAENFYRKDMEYWELDKLIAEIDELGRKEKGSAHSGPGSTGHRLKDTASIIGVTDAYVSTAIKRHKLREQMPEVFEKCKTQKDANLLIKKLEDTAIKHEISKKIEEEKSSNIHIKKLIDSYIVKDFFSGVKEIPDSVIDLVEIDPPYSVNLGKVKYKKLSDYQYNMDSYNEISEEQYPEFLLRTFKECYRVMSEDSWLICWFAPHPWFEVVYQSLLTAGFKGNRICGIWAKPSGQCINPDKYLANSYETFFYMRKGNPKIHRQGMTNVFKHSPIAPQNKTHPTERPVELMEDLYDIFAKPSSRVLIPFLGSGNGLIAAYKLGMQSIGFEISEEYKNSFIIKVGKLTLK